ncbi:MAG: hypothetical protein ACI3XW_04070 [Butyricicoccus sp.]
MTAYQQLIHVMKETYPEALMEHYRHPDGSIRQFRYTDHTYLGIGPEMEHAPMLPEALLRKIPKDEA